MHIVLWGACEIMESQFLDISYPSHQLPWSGIFSLGTINNYNPHERETSFLVGRVKCIDDVYHSKRIIFSYYTLLYLIFFLGSCCGGWGPPSSTCQAWRKHLSNGMKANKTLQNCVWFSAMSNVLKGEALGLMVVQMSLCLKPLEHPSKVDGIDRSR